MKHSLLLAAGVAFLTSGCATILTEDTHKVNVSTTSGKEIQVTIDGTTQQAPGIIEVKKTGDDKVLVTSDEACAKETNLNKQVESAFFINVLAGGLLGSTTDMATNKMWKYQDSVVISCK